MYDNMNNSIQNCNILKFMSQAALYFSAQPLFIQVLYMNGYYNMELICDILVEEVQLVGYLI